MNHDHLEILKSEGLPSEVKVVLASEFAKSDNLRINAEIELDKIRLSRRREVWKTPLVAALAGLITLSATFVFERISREEKFENAITEEQLRQEMRIAESRITQDLQDLSRQSIAEIEARAKQREFQYEIIRTELMREGRSNAERADVLLFLVRSGVAL